MTDALENIVIRVPKRKKEEILHVLEKTEHGIIMGKYYKNSANNKEILNAYAIYRNGLT